MMSRHNFDVTTSKIVEKKEIKLQRGTEVATLRKAEQKKVMSRHHSEVAT